MRGHIQHLQAICIGIVVVWCTLVASTAMADVPTQLNIQGILKDTNDVPMPDSSYPVTFRIYSTAGQIIWSEETSVATVNGLFTTTLGLVTPIPASLFGSTNRRLGIQVQGYPEMTPRTQLTSVPFAYESAQWTNGGANLYRASGNVGIGTTSPLRQLHVGGSGQFSARFENSNPLSAVVEFKNSSNNETWEYGVTGTTGVFNAPSGSMYLYRQGLSYAPFLMGPTGRCSMKGGLTVQDSIGDYLLIASRGTGIDTYQFFRVHSDMVVHGGIWAYISCAVNYTCPSDLRLKKNIQTLDNSLAAVERLRGVRYEWDRAGHPDRTLPEGSQIGLIAQEVREVAPEVVIEGKDGYLTVDYSKLVPLLIEGMKEQQQRIEKLEETIRGMQP